ncbi:hypothetical protein MRX96_023981 [Rhipicephalus microplus]
MVIRQRAILRRQCARCSGMYLVLYTLPVHQVQASGYRLQKSLRNVGTCPTVWVQLMENTSPSNALPNREVRTITTNTTSVNRCLLSADACYRFIYVEIGHHGSNSDGGLFSESQLPDIIFSKNEGFTPDAPLGNIGRILFYLVGDKAFPLKTYLMRPNLEKASCPFDFF